MRYYGVQNEVKAYCNRLQSETSITVTPSLVKTLNDRVESLKKSGVWSQYGLGFNDQDADSYFQRASVNDVLGRAEVCWFVRGIKALGLWQNMVSWPLRSYQNTGTGSTAFSLGGLGTFDGTLTNSPTWSRDGITFVNASTQYISTSFAYDPAQLATGFATVIKPVVTYNTSDARDICGNRNGSAATWFTKQTDGSQAISLFDSVGGHNTAGNAALISTTFANTWHFAGGFLDSGTRQFFNQANAITATATSTGGVIGSALNNFQIARGGEYSTARVWDGVIASVVVIRRNSISSSNIEALRSLLKSTLGSNLGLP